MEFSPNNHIVRLCIQGMAAEESADEAKAVELFRRAWDESTDDFERFLAAYYVARHESEVGSRLRWYETALRSAEAVADEAARSALPALHSKIAECYSELNQPKDAEVHREMKDALGSEPSDEGPFYHGTKADLKVGDLLTPGGISNYQAELVMNHVYFTGLPNGAGLAAALAQGDGRERVYVVEPTGDFENDPNVTDNKFPGNLTRSYRSNAPLKVIGEVMDWTRQTSEQVQGWKEKLANIKDEIIN